MIIIAFRPPGKHGGEDDWYLGEGYASSPSQRGERRWVRTSSLATFFDEAHTACAEYVRLSKWIDAGCPPEKNMPELPIPQGSLLALPVTIGQPLMAYNYNCDEDTENLSGRTAGFSA